MANRANTTRRAVLKAFPMFGVATVAGSVAAAASEDALTPQELIQLHIEQLSKAMCLITGGEGTWTALIRCDHRNPTMDHIMAYRTWHDADGVYHDEDILRTGRAALFPATQG